MILKCSLSLFPKFSFAKLFRALKYLMLKILAEIQKQSRVTQQIKQFPRLKYRELGRCTRTRTEKHVWTQKRVMHTHRNPCTGTLAHTNSQDTHTLSSTRTPDLWEPVTLGNLQHSKSTEAKFGLQTPSCFYSHVCSGPM